MCHCRPTANNHALDYDVKGLCDTLDYLKQANIQVRYLWLRITGFGNR